MFAKFNRTKVSLIDTGEANIKLVKKKESVYGYERSTWGWSMRLTFFV